MVFSSYEFILLFLPITLLGYWMLQASLRPVWLLAASYAFYAYWDVRYLSVLWLSTGVTYLAGVHIADARSRRWVYLGVGANLAVLGFFKYHDFFTSSILPELDLILPLGLSFYTFQNISYLLDIHQKRIQPAPSLPKFALYTAIFPHLTAGPILRFGEFEPPLSTSKTNIDRGMTFFVIGLAKKVILADQLAPLVNALLVSKTQFWGGWLAAVGYAYQLYFDFSGYSDMAIGLACLLGFYFPRNFDNPYTAHDIVDFWRRWHITLTNWLRDYVFLPSSRVMLRRSWHRLLAMLLAYLLTMTISGIWHGTGITFLLWGIYHGILICIFQIWRWFKMPPLPVSLARVITFLSVVFGWVLFRADSLDRATEQYKSMIGLNGFESLQTIPNLSVYIGCILIFALVWTNLKMDTWDLTVPSHPVFGLALAAIFVTCLMLLATSSPFLYFQF